MTVKEIIKQSAVFLNASEIVNYLDKGVAENFSSVLEEVDLLVNCYNVVAEEIASSHYRFKAVESFSPKNNRVTLSEFSFNPLAIINVFDKGGVKVNATILPTEIQTNLPYITVEYYYIPNPKTLDDISDFKDTLIKKRTLAYGIITEYLLIKGSYEEASVWHEKYAQSLITLKGNTGRVKGRVWR